MLFSLRTRLWGNSRKDFCTQQTVKLWQLLLESHGGKSFKGSKERKDKKK